MSIWAWKCRDMRLKTASTVLVLALSPCAPMHAAPAAADGNSPPAKSQDPLHRESPRSSVYSFLQACHARNYGEAWRYIDMRNAPAEQRSKGGPQLAQQLEQVLDRDVQFDVASLNGSAEGDQADGLPANRERVDSFNLNGRRVELDLEHVTLHSGLSVWLFSSDSVALIPQLARLASDSPLERHLPLPLVEWKLIGTPLWRWIAILLLAVVLVPLSRLVSRPAVRFAELATVRLAPRLNANTLAVFVAPLRLLLWVMGFRAGIEWVGPTALLRLYLERLVTFLFFLALAWLCMAVVDITIRRLRTVFETRHQSFSYSVLPMASRFAKIIILMLMIAAVLSSWGYNTTTILAGLGVGGLAIALAAQKTIENLFGGVAVITDQPVSVGDFCKFGDRSGTVEDIGLRSTRIRTINRSLVTVPNGEFSAMVLENFSKQDKTLFHITLNLRRDTQPGQVRSLLESITRTLKERPKVETGAMPVRFVGLGTYSLDVEVFAYVLTRDGDEFMKIQQELLLWILDAVEAAGTALAVPTAYLPLGGAARQYGAPSAREPEPEPAGRRSQ